jgi:hypothetical protein
METQTPEMTVAGQGNSESVSVAEKNTVLAAAVPSFSVEPATCSTCAGAQNSAPVASPSWVYVIGHIEPRFPLLSIEKEMRQAISRGGPFNGTDTEAMARVLEDPRNKYLVRQLCWVLSVQGIETYILVPSDGDYQPLIDAYRAEPNPGDLDLVIGIRGPMAPPTMCNGLQVPIVIFNQIYAFDRTTILASINKPEGADAARFDAAAGAMLDRITSQLDNAGGTDADRALNYLAVRYERIYALAAEQFSTNASFTSVDVLPSPLGGSRRIVDVVFTFTDRATDVSSKFFTRVDVTEAFPFLVSKLAPYFDR